MKAYDESLKAYWDNYSTLEMAKEEGREEGRKEGMEEGKVKIAREMKKEGLPVSQMRITGLSK